MDFAIPADKRVKLKESEKKDNYMDLARKLKKLWNMKVTVIRIVIDALGTVSKGLEQGLEDLFGSARTQRRILETWGDLLLFKLQWKSIG